MIKVSVQNHQQAQNEIREALRKFGTDKSVTVGIHEDDNARPDGDLTNASLGAIHHFGADIDHPGGTSYGYASQSDAEQGKVKFLKKGAGFMVLGETGPHKIGIPARPWLDVGVAQGNQEYINLIKDVIGDGGTLEKALEQIGTAAVGFTQEYMSDLKSPPNSKSTVAKKGFNNPLVNSGELRQSVSYKVVNKLPDEGL